MVGRYEAREIAGGASGRNGGFALRGGAAPYPVMVESIGRDAAAGVWPGPRAPSTRAGSPAAMPSGEPGACALRLTTRSAKSSRLNTRRCARTASLWSGGTTSAAALGPVSGRDLPSAR